MLDELTARVVVRHDVADSRQALARHVDLLKQAELVSSKKRGMCLKPVSINEALRAVKDQSLK